MKLDILRKIIREEVKGAIQDELKEILLEAVKSNKQPIQESYSIPTTQSPPPPTKTKEQIRESYQNILGDTAANFNTSQIAQPLQVTTTDTASPNGQLPAGNVSMDQIMGLMNRG
jgi:hypothetical protein